MLPLSVLMTLSLAWGPYTHQYFGAHLDHDPAMASSESFIAGCSAPDAFKNLVPSMHSLAFAAALFKQSTRGNGTADEQAFALGYGCHLCQDMVGHHANGFLNPSEDHPLELAIDAYVFKEDPSSHILRGRHFQKHAPFQQISDVMTALVVATTLSAGDNVTKNITQTQAVKAVSDFKTLTTEEEAALVVDLLYQKSAIKDSFCKVQSFPAVQANFALAQNWSAQVCTQWQTFMKKDYSAPNAIQEIIHSINTIFQAHNGTSCVIKNSNS